MSTCETCGDACANIRMFQRPATLAECLEAIDGDVDIHRDAKGRQIRTLHLCDGCYRPAVIEQASAEIEQFAKAAAAALQGD